MKSLNHKERKFIPEIEEIIKELAIKEIRAEKAIEDEEFLEKLDTVKILESL